MKNQSITPHNKVYDRALKKDVAGIATTFDRFTLENGYYVNENETIICKSTNETGKFFRKLPVSDEKNC